MTAIYILLALGWIGCIVLLVAWFAMRKGQGGLEQRLHESEDRASQEVRARMEEGVERTERITQLSSDLARAQERNESLSRQIERDKEELEVLQASFRHEFRNLASEMLEERSKQFKESNKEAMESLMKPFGENISQFKERVETIYSDENQQRGSLRNELKTLFDLNSRITQETTNLTNALRGNSKVQGDWGEMILQTMLENFNLIEGTHYTMQENLKDKDGRNLRPDVIVNLPDNKRVVIDAKVSLTAFVNYSAESDQTQREVHLREHVASVKRHVVELASKGYHELEQLDGQSPDFVIMFVPNEPAYMTALQSDNAIWSDAYNKKIIITSPTNLFTVIKIVDDLWKRDNQSKNALEIARQGAEMYDKFVGFVETLAVVGRNINTASESYEKALGQLVDGRGNLVGRAERLRKLGVKSSKELPAGMIADAEDDDDVDEQEQDDE